MGPNPRRRRSANDCSVSTCILTKTNEDEEENERDTKKMESASNKNIIEKIIPTYIHL